jgi:hypothetical protein
MQCICTVYCTNTILGTVTDLYCIFVCLLCTNFVTGLVTDDTIGDDRPLSQDELSILYTNLNFFEETIVSDCGLIEHLLAANCLTYQQMQYINESRRSEKNSLLLDILTRRSFADIKCFVISLHKTGQSHVARVLEEGGGKPLSLCMVHILCTCS